MSVYGFSKRNAERIAKSVAHTESVGLPHHLRGKNNSITQVPCQVGTALDNFFPAGTDSDGPYGAIAVRFDTVKAVGAGLNNQNTYFPIPGPGDDEYDPDQYIWPVYNIGDASITIGSRVLCLWLQTAVDQNEKPLGIWVTSRHFLTGTGGDDTGYGRLLSNTTHFSSSAAGNVEFATSETDVEGIITPDIVEGAADYNALKFNADGNYLIGFNAVATHTTTAPSGDGCANVEIRRGNMNLRKYNNGDTTDYPSWPITILGMCSAFIEFPVSFQIPTFMSAGWHMQLRRDDGISATSNTLTAELWAIGPLARP